MQLLRQRAKSSVYVAGIVSLLLSLLIYNVPSFADQNEGLNVTLLMFNYMITIGYFVILLVNRKTVEPKEKIHHTFLLLILAFISAWSLNRSIPIFENSTQWFSILQVLVCLNYIGMAYSEALPKWAVHAMSFTAGVAFLTFFYLAAYLLPVYPIGAIAFLFFGISLHTFVPLAFSIYTLILMRKVTQDNKRYYISFLGGLLASLAFVSSYVGLWGATQKKINKALTQTDSTSGLPSWVPVVRDIPSGFFSNKILQTDVVFTVPEDERREFFSGLPMKDFAEDIKEHDPLVMTSVFFSGKLDINYNVKVKILESMYGLKHETQDRLWSGSDLHTSQVATDVKLWAACNIAYTEKTLKITNSSSLRTLPQEAIYTFYMPEGAVVTSLSLWINGKEEKGILTTKAKADSAYRAIVGVERRDPSIVHWQEGNTVSVRVFPVPAMDNRQFKIGVTAPLKRVNGKLQYENIYFKGPEYSHAEEDIQFYFEQPVSDFQVPASFVSMSKQSYTRKGKYEPFWSMYISDPGLTNCDFSFDNNTYSLAPYHKKLSPATINTVYLDINKSWTKTEFNQVTDLVKDLDVFVYDSQLTKLTRENKKEIWDRFQGRQFSLFPLFEINNPAQSLLITKNSPASPSLDELEGSMFMQETKAFLGRGQKVKLFDLGAELSPYLKSLKEFRVFQYDKGDMGLLTELMTKKFFPDDMEDDSQVIIHQADMVIQKKAGTCASSGTDHLMRLFTYNHIMQKLGTGLLTNRSPDDILVDEAAKAYVVTPVSSLAVLETQEDYDRFDIKDQQGASLKNASIQSKGAVPEPHEWALIITAGLVLVYVMKGKKLRFS